MANVITLLGVGNDEGKSLPSKSLEIIKNCQLLIGIQKLTDLFPDTQAEKVLLPNYVDELVKIHKKNSDKQTVVLASTDSNLFGISKFLLKRFSRKDLRIFPHPSSMELAFSTIKEPMEGAVITSVHDHEPQALVKLIREQRRVGLFTDPSMTAFEVAQLLIADGIKDCRVHLCQDINTRRQKIQEMTLEGLGRRRFSPLCILVLLKKAVSESVATVLPTWSFGIPDERIAHREGMIIPSEIRAVILSKLQLKPDLLLWEIGTGSGAFSVEASRLLKFKELYVIERDLVQVRHLYENIHRFDADSITVIEGEIPEVLKDIPDPDRVLIGSWVSSLTRVLKTVHDRLRPDGVFVIHTHSLDALSEAKLFLREHAYDEEDISLLISKKRGTGASETIYTSHPTYLLVSKKRP